MHKFLDTTLGDLCAILNPKAPEAMKDLYIQTQAGSCERSMEETVRELMSASSSTSAEYRVANAILAQSMARSAAVQGGHQTVKMHRRGRQDFSEIMDTGALEDTSSGRRRIDAASLQDLVRFVLGEENTLKLAWKVITHKTVLADDGKPTTIPSLTRKRSRNAVWRAYKARPAPEGVRKVGRTNFRKVIKAITRAESKSLRALDYYLTDLLLFPCERLERIIEDAVSDNELLKTTLLSELALVYKTLQHSYPKLVKIPSSTDSSSPAHSAPYALGHPEHPEATGDPCSSCASIVRWFLERLPTAHPNLAAYFDEANMHAPNNVIGHCYEKAKLWMGHSVRAAVQTLRITELRNQATEQATLLKVHVVMDYMMKFEPERYRESTRENYGKRGLSVHGTTVSYKRRDGSTFMRHYHTAVDGSSKQDVGASLTMFELMCFNLRRDLPAEWEGRARVATRDCVTFGGLD